MHAINPGAGLYWNLPLKDLSKQQRKLFANNLKDIWQKTILKMGAEQMEIDVIIRKKTLNAKKPGKEDIQLRAAKHYLKTSDKTIGDLYKTLQGQGLSNRATELMGNSASIQPPQLGTIINEHVRTLLPKSVLNELIASICEKTKSKGKTAILFAFHGSFPSANDNMSGSEVITRWINHSDEATIRNLLNTLTALNAGGRRDLYDALYKAGKVGCSFDDFKTTVKSTLKEITKDDLTGDKYQIPASTLDKNFTEVLRRDYCNELFDSKELETFMKILTTVFPDTKTEFLKVVTYYQSNINLFLSMYRAVPLPDANTSHPRNPRPDLGGFGFGGLETPDLFAHYEAMVGGIRPGAALPTTEPVSLRVFVLVLTLMGATNQLKGIKNVLNIASTPVQQPSQSSQSSSSSSSSTASIKLTNCGLPKKNAEAPVKDNKAKILILIEGQKIAFGDLLKAFRKIATEDEKKIIRDLSASENAKQILRQLMDGSGFTYARLGHCLNELNAESAIVKMRDIALDLYDTSQGVVEKEVVNPIPAVPAVPAVVLMSAIIPEDIMYTSELKTLANKLEFTAENLDLPQKPDGASFIQALLWKWKQQNSELTLAVVKETCNGLNPEFVNKCEEIYKMISG